jgi:hypothetical protein
MARRLSIAGEGHRQDAAAQGRNAERARDRPAVKRDAEEALNAKDHAALATECSMVQCRL